MGFRDRDDFVENIHMAHTHLLICVEDIKYPLTPKLQEALEYAEKATGIILQAVMREGIEDILRALGAQRKEEAALAEAHND